MDRSTSTVLQNTNVIDVVEMFHGMYPLMACEHTSTNVC